MTDPHALRALITVMRHHAESYESQAEGRSADDFEFLMDLSGLVTAWADALAEALEGRPAPPPQVGSKLEEPLQELADLEAEMRTYVCWGRPKVSVWLERLTAIRKALT